MMIIIEIILNDYMIKMKNPCKDEESVHMNTYVAGSFY